MKTVVPILLLIVSSLSFAQERPQASRIFRTEDDLCSESIKALIDQLFIKLNENTSSHGLIISSADKKIPGRYRHYVGAIREFIEFRHYPSNRVKFARKANDAHMVFEYWVVPEGASEPVIAPYVPKDAVASVLFDKSLINSIDKRRVYFGGEDEPCDYGLNFAEFSNSLVQNKLVVGQLVAFSGAGADRKKALTALSLTKRMLEREYHVPASQLRTYYGGRRTDPQMQLWLTPPQDQFSLRMARERSSLR